MDSVEFNALINKRLAEGAEPRQRQPLPNDRFAVGDIVRHTVAFQQRVQGYADDVAGEVIGVRGRVIRVRWDDGHESSALDSNLEKPAPPTPIDHEAFAEHLRRQDLITVERGILIGEAWNR